MKRLAIALLFVLFGGSAFASCPSLPYNLANGTTADANQVMANFNSLLNCFNSSATNILRGYLSGLTLSNDATAPNAVIDVAAGVATSDDGTTSMTISSAMIKNANAAWAVGTNGGCLDSGAALAANAWYHTFVVERTDTGVADVLCSMSPSAPTLPTNYTKQRRIGSFKTDASAHILAFSQNGDEFLWKTEYANASNVPTSQTASTITMMVPTGVEVWVKMNFLYEFSATTTGILFYALDQGTQVFQGAASSQGNAYATSSADIKFGDLTVRTNTSGQIGVVAGFTGGIYWVGTYGWIDRRGRDS